MITAICITILVYCLLGKDVKALLSKLNGVDWKAKARELLDMLRPYALKVGRIAARPLVTLYYVLADDKTSTLDKALIYAALIYIISPVSLIPASVYHLLGILDEGAAAAYVYKKVKELVTPDIERSVKETLDEWFGTEYEIA